MLLNISLLCLAAAGAASAQPTAAPVVATPVIEQEVTAGHYFVGTVMPSKRAVVGSAVDGRVIEFPHNEGDRIEEGEAIAQLLTKTISLELAAAEADLDFRKEQLAELKNGTRPQEIEQLKARLAAAKARRDYLEVHRARTQKAFKAQNAATEDALDSAVSEAIEAKQSYREIQAALDLAREGPRAERIAQARAQVAVAEATVEKLRDQIAKHTIISRFSGYLVAEHTEIGQWVQRGDPVAEIAALDIVEITVHVVEKSIPHVRLGDDVRVEIPALPERSFQGEVVAIVPQADVRARTFPVKVRVENEVRGDGPLIKSGMYARLMLPTSVTQQAMLVPKDALVLGGPRTVVFVINPSDKQRKHSTVSPVPVELGVATGELIQVKGALHPGDLVVVQGNERLQSGQQVSIILATDPEEEAPATESQSSAP